MFYIKFFIIKILRFILNVFRVLHLKDHKYFFISWNGLSYNCNPKSIFEELVKCSANGYEFVWCLDNPMKLPEEYRSKVTVVQPYSIKFIINYMTSKYVISNSGFSNYIPKRRMQVFINTWHGGGAYKKVGANVATLKYRKFINSEVAKQTQNTTFFISSSKAFSDAIHNDMGIGYEKFLNYGMPRNDILFNSAAVENISANIRKTLQIDEFTGVVLYAPTYRGENLATGSTISSTLDILKIKKALELKFNKPFVFLLKEHPPIPTSHSENSIDVSDFDTQELLCACDVLITDYSSIMWDFSFLKRPGFLFVPDIDDYISKRGFVTDIDRWGYDIAKSNDEFVSVIESLDLNKYVYKQKVNHDYFESYEDGHATDRIVALIR